MKPKLLISITLPLLLLPILGCQSRPSIIGAWTVDPASKIILFGTAHSKVDVRVGDKPTKDADTLAKPFQRGNVEDKMQQRITSRIYVFHSGKDGNPYSDKFDGLYEVQKDGQTISFGAWKHLPSPKDAPKSAPDSYEIYEPLSDNIFQDQGTFIISGANPSDAQWRPRLGDMGGMTLVLHREKAK